MMGGVTETRPPYAARCSQCGGDRFEEGFLEDAGQGSQGFARWIPGPLQLGIFGGAKKMGRPRFPVRAYVCQGCGLVQLYATRE